VLLTTHPLLVPRSWKSRAIPLPTLWATSGLFTIFNLDRGGWATPRFGRFVPEKDPVPIVEEGGWAPGSVWTGAEN